MTTELDQRFADVAVELGVVAARIGELVDVVSGDAIAVPLRVVIDAVRNPSSGSRSRATTARTSPPSTSSSPRIWGA
jgi:hypothetical protein